MSKIIANEVMIEEIESLKSVRALIKHAKRQEEEIITRIGLFMQDNELLLTHDGEELCTYKYTSDVQYFDNKRLKSENEALYNLYVSMRPGTRRMMVK